MISNESMLSWWAAGGNRFNDIGSVLPGIVIHGIDENRDATPTPLIIGPDSLHAGVFGIETVSEYVSLLNGPLREMAESAAEVHRIVAETREPDISARFVYSEHLGRWVSYERLALPVLGPRGEQMIVTHSSPIVVH